jgi:hypothetical protein
MRTLWSLLIFISVSLLCVAQEMWGYNPWGVYQWDTWRNFGWMPPYSKTLKSFLYIFISEHHHHHYKHRHGYRYPNHKMSSGCSEDSRERHKLDKYPDYRYPGSLRHSDNFPRNNGPNINTGVGPIPRNFGNPPIFPENGNMNILPSPPIIPPPPNNLFEPQGPPTSEVGPVGDGSFSPIELGDKPRGPPAAVA